MTLARSRFLFTGLLAVMALPLLWRAFWLHPLYLNAEIRAQTQHAIMQVVEREGWLLSDVSLKAVDEGWEPDGWRAVIAHRPHLRGKDPSTCYIILLSNASLQPCRD